MKPQAPQNHNEPQARQNPQVEQPFNAFAKSNSPLEKEIDRRAREYARKCNVSFEAAVQYALFEIDGEEKLNKLQEERAQDADMEAADRMSQAYQQAIREGKSAEAALRAAEKAKRQVKTQ